MNDSQLQQFAQQLVGQVQSAGAAAAGAAKLARQAENAFNQVRGVVDKHSQHNASLVEKLARLEGAMDALKSGGPRGAVEGPADLTYIESLPGRRVPFDIIVSIPIPANQTAPITQPYTLSTDGAFVATKRYAIFVSAYTFQVTVERAATRYNGRSYGRQRPISSHLDLMDAQQGWNDFWPYEDPDAFGCGQGATPPLASIPSRPSSRSPFRTMEGDFYIQLSNTVYPRQNTKVPSGLWAQGFDGVTPLSVQDYFAKAETINFEIEPMHPSNPEYGNVQSILGSMPYLAGQFDGHEGVHYPNGWVCLDAQADSIARNPAGWLIVGLQGYRIIEPPGVRMP
jgi:hypothetical protein